MAKQVMLVFLDVGQGDGTLIIGPEEQLVGGQQRTHQGGLSCPRR
jgi:hypothetical protein